MKLCGQEFSKETIGRIQSTIDSEPELSRSGLSRRVCELLDWRTPKGKLKQMSCRVALLGLEREGEIKLPAAKEFAGRNKRRYEAPTRGPEKPWSGKLEKLQPIELIQVGSADSRASREWNEMMSRHHYLGAGRYVEHRYGIWSTAPAMDTWAGWHFLRRHGDWKRVITGSDGVMKRDSRI